MPKSAVADWSTTAASNTDVGGVSIAEGWAAKDINDALREMMAQIKTWHGNAAKYCAMQNAAAQNLVYNTATALTWETTIADAAGMAAASGTDITIPAGVSMISVTAWVQTAAVAANGAIWMDVYQTGGSTGVAAATSVHALAGNGVYLNVTSGQFAVTAGDVINVRVTQQTDNPGPLATVAGSSVVRVQVIL